MAGGLSELWRAGLAGAVGRWGPAGVAVLMFLDGACVPVPSEPILAFAGFLAARRGGGLPALVLMANLAFLAGSAAAYAAARAGGRALVSRWGTALGLRADALEQLERWFARWGGLAVFGARFVPGARTLVSIPAGIARMPPVRFLWLTFLGSLPWSYGFAYAGYALGERWSDIRLPLTWVAGAGFAALALLAVRGLRRPRPGC